MPEPRARSYIVVGKDLKAGVPGSDSSDSEQYFELGWEVTTTYLETVYGRQTGRFSGEETVVTASGREFLYRASFADVMTFTDFSALGIDPPQVIDLVRRTSARYTGDTWLRKLRLRAACLRAYHWWQYRIRYRSAAMRNLPMALPALDPARLAEEFYCLCIRFRDHQPQRNLPGEYLIELLDALRDRRCFLVGHGSEQLIRHPLHHVCTLAEFAALARHPQCAAVIGSMTGTMQLAQMIHRRRLLVIDLDRHYHLWGRLYPSVLSDLCNFPGVPHLLYEYRPSIAQLTSDLAMPHPESRITDEAYREDPRFFDEERRLNHALFQYDR